MGLAHSRVTAQGQISVPAAVRRKLGIGPGAVLEWEDRGNQVLVRRAGRFTSEDVHGALFHGRPPQPRTVEEMKEGVRRHIKARHARG
ncbi:MAG: AbrB/MazE/SpoVT family DNA-binding domain-containing protein [Acidobacteria bacterium]|nr:AbrB/MazE/SpoVT family DNA-binding domain-containing protein [Acidobacteriota bacterium]